MSDLSIFPLIFIILSDFPQTTISTYIHIYIYIYISQYIYIYTPYLVGWALEWGICRMPHTLKCSSSSHELSTPVRICKKIYAYKIPTCYAENGDVSGVSYPTEVKSTGFPSRLEASRGSSCTEELWHNETVCLQMTCIYIYIYIYTSNLLLT